LHGERRQRKPRNCTAYRAVLLSRPSPKNILQEAPNAMAVIPAQKLQSIVQETFVKAGCSPEEGERIASHLVMANLSGHDSHGVIRVPVYIGWLKEGLVEANKDVKVVTDTPVLAVVDGQYGFGQSTAPQAVRIGIEKCKAMGLSAVALRNTGHIGRIGAWAEMAAAEDLVSVHFVNAAGSILVAPFGAVERRFSTAPFSVGVPRPGQPPIILDFATSLVAEGKVLVASRGGKALPSDALIGPDGKVGNDPTLLYGPYEQDGARNHRLGEELAKGRRWADIEAALPGVAEGAYTVDAAIALAARHNVEMPIAQEVHNALFEGKSVQRCLFDLLARESKDELADFPAWAERMRVDAPL